MDVVTNVRISIQKTKKRENLELFYFLKFTSKSDRDSFLHH